MQHEKLRTMEIDLQSKDVPLPEHHSTPHSEETLLKLSFQTFERNETSKEVVFHLHSMSLLADISELFVYLFKRRKIGAKKRREHLLIRLNANIFKNNTIKK